MIRSFAGRPGSGEQPREFLSLDNVMDLLLDAVCLVDADGYFVFASAACERIFGYPPEEMVGRCIKDMVHPEHLERTLEAADRVLAGQPLVHFENCYIRKDGQPVHVMWSAQWSEKDQLRIAVARDVTERKRSEALQAALYAISEAAFSTQNLDELFQHTHEVIASLLPANNFFVALYDRDSDELSFPYFVDPSHEAPAPQPLDAGALSAEIIRTGQALLLNPLSRSTLNEPDRPDIAKGALEWLGVPLVSPSGTIGVLAVQSYMADVYRERDVELLQYVSTQVAAALERKRMEHRLQHAALHDPLTGLPNRALFHDRLENALALARRDKSLLSLLYLDLDRFKQVNDTYGHATGDVLLQEVARRLTSCVRESDTVGRIGGDEFLILLSGVGYPDDALIVAEKVRSVLLESYDVGGLRLSIAPSIGIAGYPEHGDDYRQLIRMADESMYRAKKQGGNRFDATVQGEHTPS
ncbi:sensor domain-containing protein [Mangrovitalea sediminis]|uniref:sensor domain-containing protein n=1 Tax=Mangrovitalea sediminis TaxID=1982043 RepID=UPI0018E9230D|nr:diguanylate cyclase [Mangrovitalea sediminis]